MASEDGSANYVHPPGEVPSAAYIDGDTVYLITAREAAEGSEQLNLRDVVQGLIDTSPRRP